MAQVGDPAVEVVAVPHRQHLVQADVSQRLGAGLDRVDDRMGSPLPGPTIRSAPGSMWSSAASGGQRFLSRRVPACDAVAAFMKPTLSDRLPRHSAPLRPGNASEVQDIEARAGVGVVEVAAPGSNAGCDTAMFPAPKRAAEPASAARRSSRSRAGAGVADVEDPQSRVDRRAGHDRRVHVARHRAVVHRVADDLVGRRAPPGRRPRRGGSCAC